MSESASPVGAALGARDAVGRGAEGGAVGPGDGRAADALDGAGVGAGAVAVSYTHLTLPTKA